MKNIAPPITEIIVKMVMLSRSSKEHSNLLSLRHSQHLAMLHAFILHVDLVPSFRWNVGNIGHFFFGGVVVSLFLSLMACSGLKTIHWC